MKVHFLHQPTEMQLAYFNQRLERPVRVSSGPEPDAIYGCDIFIGGRPVREQLEASSSLKYLIIPFSGIPDKTRSLLLEFPEVSVHNLHHNAAPTAELAAALLLGASKYLLRYDNSLRKNDWSLRYAESPAVLLEGKTALILGYGAIGQRIGTICKALGMHVKGIKRSVLPDDRQNYQIEIYTTDSLHALLPISDVLILTVPMSPETENIIGKVELDLMPAGSIVINVARGPVLNERAFYEALASNKLAAGGTDVWYNYPENEGARKNTPPGNYPFHELDNLIMSPHRGGMTADTEKLRYNALAELVNSALRGEELPNKVNLTRGY